MFIQIWIHLALLEDMQTMEKLIAELQATFSAASRGSVRNTRKRNSPRTPRNSSSA